MAKRTSSPADQWGTPEHDAWMERTYGPKRQEHPTGCQCPPCKKAYEWVKGYQSYIARVDRGR